MWNSFLRILATVLLIGSYVKGSGELITRTVRGMEISVTEGDGLTAEQRVSFDNYLAYLKRLNALCDNPDRIEKAITHYALLQKVPGGITGLAHLVKGDRSVTLISSAGSPSGHWYTRYTCSEELIKSLVIPFFSVWHQASEPVALFLDIPHERGYSSADGICDLGQWAQRFYCGIVDSDAPTFELLTLSVAEQISLEKERLGFGALHIEVSNRIRDRLIAEEKLPLLSLPGAAQFAEITQNITAICATLMQYQIGRRESTKKFLVNEENIAAMIASTLGKNKEMTLSRYLDLLSELLSAFEKTRDAATHDLLKLKIEKARRDLQLLAEQLPALFALHLPEWHKVSLERFMLHLAKGAQSAQEFMLQLKHLLMYVYTVTQIAETAYILDLLPRYKHVIIFKRDASDETVNFLKQLGFTGTTHGTFAPAGEMVVDEGSPFLATHVVTFLDGVTKALKPDYNEVTDPRHFEHINPFLQYVEDPFLPDEIRVHDQKPLLLGSATRYIDMASGKVAHHSFIDTTEISCAECGRLFPRSRAVATFLDKRDLCSEVCLARGFLKGNVPLKELVDKAVMTHEDKKVLQQLAALCTLRYLSLSPSARHNQSAFYQLQHDLLKVLFVDLLKNGPSHLAWSRTISLAKMLSIDLHHLSIFCETYRLIKKEYLQDLLARAKYKRFKDLSQESPPDFDERGSIAKYQTKQYDTLRAQWGLNEITPSESLPTLYYELLKIIRTKVPFSFDAIDFYLRLNREHLANDKPAARVAVIKPVVKKADRKQKPLRSVAPPSTVINEIDLMDEVDDGYDEPHDEGTEEALIPVLSEPGRIPVRIMEHFDFDCWFARKIPYAIRFYNTLPFISEDNETGRALWNQCSQPRDSYRVFAIAALAQEIELDAQISRTAYGTYIMHCEDEGYEDSLKEKLDLHHLFPQKVDRYIRKFGIAELIEPSLIQLSLPGKIRYDDGLIETGFFQLTYVPEGWTCIHRCFKVWRNQKSKYISPLLQSLLQKMEHDVIL